MADSELPRPINSESIDEKERYRKLYESMATHTNSDRQKNISYGVNKQSNLTTKLIIRDRDKDPKELERISEKPTQTLEKQLSDSDSDSNEVEMLKRSNADATKNSRLTQVDNGVMLYDFFIINKIRYNAKQKFQVIDTFDDSFLYSFGEKPVTAQFSGVLFNVLNQKEGKVGKTDRNATNWRSSWMFTYDKLLNATNSISGNTDVYINFEDILWKGRVLNTSWRLNANRAPEAVNFSFTFYIEDKRNDIISHKPPHEVHDTDHNLRLQNTITELAKSETSAEEMKQRVQDSISRPNEEAIQEKLDKTLENTEDEDNGEPDLIEALNDSMELSNTECGDVPREVNELNQEISGDPSQSGGPETTIKNWVYGPVSNKSATGGIRERITRNIAGDTINFRNERDHEKYNMASSMSRSPSSLAGPSNILNFLGSAIQVAIKHIGKAYRDDGIDDNKQPVIKGLFLSIKAVNFNKDYIIGTDHIWDANEQGDGSFNRDEYNIIVGGGEGQGSQYEDPDDPKAADLTDASQAKQLKNLVGNAFTGESSSFQISGGDIPGNKIKQGIRKMNFKPEFSLPEFLSFVWQGAGGSLYKSPSELENVSDDDFTTSKIHDTPDDEAIGNLNDVIGNTAEVLKEIGYSNISSFKSEIEDAAASNNIKLIKDDSVSWFNPKIFEKFRFYNPLPKDITVDKIKTANNGSANELKVNEEGLVTSLNNNPKVEEVLSEPSTKVNLVTTMKNGAGIVEVDFSGVGIGDKTINFDDSGPVNIAIGAQQFAVPPEDIKEKIKKYRARHNKFTYSGPDDDDGRCASVTDADIEDSDDTVDMTENTPNGDDNPFEGNISSGIVEGAESSGGASGDSEPFEFESKTSNETVKVDTAGGQTAINVSN